MNLWMNDSKYNIIINKKLLLQIFIFPHKFTFFFVKEKLHISVFDNFFSNNDEYIYITIFRIILFMKL